MFLYREAYLCGDGGFDNHATFLLRQWGNAELKA